MLQAPPQQISSSCTGRKTVLYCLQPGCSRALGAYHSLEQVNGGLGLVEALSIVADDQGQLGGLLYAVAAC